MIHVAQEHCAENREKVQADDSLWQGTILT